MIKKITTAIFPALLALTVLMLPAGGRASTAEQNFKWYCVQCHDEDGGGDGINNVAELPVGPMALNKAEEMEKFTDDQIIKTITHGGPANNLESLMPTWGNTLTDKEIKELMKYVRSLCKDAVCPK